VTGNPVSGYTGAGIVVVVGGSVVVGGRVVVVGSAVVDGAPEVDGAVLELSLHAAPTSAPTARRTDVRRRDDRARILDMATHSVSGPDGGGGTPPSVGRSSGTPDSLRRVSPLAPVEPSNTPDQPDMIVTITPEAIAELLVLRDSEPDADRLGLRVEIVSAPGEDFRYDLSFDVVTKAAFTDEVRTHRLDDGRSLKVIVPATSMESISGATLDYSGSAGLVIRNPNKPMAPMVEGLVRDDELSARIESVISAEVNPALAAHGGFVTYVGHDETGTAFLTMGGGCHGCSMSRMTMLEGVQTTIIEQVPEVERVRDLTDHATGETPFYR
jgi:Fe/S biogenesis protein NfuA